METAKRPFGTMPDGAPVEELTLTDGALTAGVITYGGALRSLLVPDRAGDPVDVLLGFDTLEGYRTQDKYIGALIGRYANRIGGSRFPLAGKEYRLAANESPNHLHGGAVGFDKQVWTVRKHTANALTLCLRSPDGQEGYPGSLEVTVTYTLRDSALTIDYRAVSDRTTLCNLTSHAYWNLSGHGSGDIAGQRFRLPGSRYTPVDSRAIPTGTIDPVEGTPMDLRQLQALGEREYDHNWVVEGWAGDHTLRPAAQAESPSTGITMEVLTTMPGIQFYTGNFLEGCPRGKGGAVYPKHGAPSAWRPSITPIPPTTPASPARCCLPERSGGAARYIALERRIIMTDTERKFLAAMACKVRLGILEGTHGAKSGHPGGSLSAADLFTYLYFKELRVDPENPGWKDRDRFVLSKGHTAPGLYAALACKGFFPAEKLPTLRHIDSELQGHPNMNTVPGVDMSTGSLGQGISAAAGMALAAKRMGKDCRIYALLGDGEIQEGQVWEAMMFAHHYHLDNLCAVIDNNGLQIDGPVDQVMDPYPIGDKLRAFGWEVAEIDGHDFDQLEAAFAKARAAKGVPTGIVMKTTKGKGVSFMENQAGWHGKAPNDQEYEAAVAEIRACLAEVEAR